MRQLQLELYSTDAAARVLSVVPGVWMTSELLDLFFNAKYAQLDALEPCWRIMSHELRCGDLNCTKLGDHPGEWTYITRATERKLKFVTDRGEIIYIERLLGADGLESRYHISIDFARDSCHLAANLIIEAGKALQEHFDRPETMAKQ